MNKVNKIGKSSEWSIIATMRIVGFHTKIHDGESLSSFLRFLEARDNKQISTDPLAELAHVLLKDNKFVIIYLLM